MKLKLGQHIGEGATNSKPPGRIVVMGQSETLRSSLIIFITLFSPGEKRYGAFQQPPHTLQLY